MLKVRKIHLLAFAAFFFMFTGIPETFFAWFYLGLGLGLMSAGGRFLIRWWALKKDS